MPTRPVSQTKYIDDIWSRGAGASTSIPWPTQQIRKGQGFRANLVDVTIPAVSTVYIRGALGSRVINYFEQIIYGAAFDLQFRFYEDPTVDTAGSAVGTIINVNRLSANTSDVTFDVGPTLTSNGTLLNEGRFSSGADKGVTPGPTTLTSGLGWVLDPSKDYLLEFVNNDSMERVITIDFFWAEQLLDLSLIHI